MGCRIIACGEYANQMNASQAAQIQKVSDQLKAQASAPRVVAND
jgi:hypothetical protein